MEHSPLEIRLFGAFGAWVEGQPLPPLRSRAEKWLLTLLALRPGNAVSREWLSATLWPDSETALGLYNLRRCLTNLRKVLGDQSGLLQSPTPQTICLDRAHVLVDVAGFDAAVADGSIESLETAAALYQGPLLEDCTEEWALTARIEREQAYLAALEALAAHAASIGQTTTAIRYLRLTIAADPLREAAYGTLMQALADCGDYAALTQVYRDLRLLLHRELNLEPSSEIEALYRRLQQQSKQAVLPVTAPSHLPPRRIPVPLTPLVGRETDIEEVVDRLQKERLVTLSGSGGVGKTRLAIAIAEALLPMFPDGVWFVELASITDPTLVADAVARTLGVKEEIGRPLLETLAAALAARKALVILDNCEHLLDACAGLADSLLAHCSELRLLATSREAFGLVGEYRYDTPSLALPPLPSEETHSPYWEKDLAWLMEYGGMRLFVERAMQVQPAFRLTAHNADAVLGVVRYLDGIPLAIELAAARVRSLSIGEILPRLRDCLSLLGGGHRTALPRHQTLRALIDWSYDLLTPAEQSLLQSLSVFSGGWSLDAAEAVCGAHENETSGNGPSVISEGAPSLPAPSLLTSDQIVDLLTALVDKSLVVYEERQGEARYRLLETVRVYAGDRLAERRETAFYRRRHRDFFLALAELAHESLVGRDQVVWLGKLAVEHDNLRQALTLCLEDEEAGEIGMRLALALQRFWQMRNHWSEGQEWFTALLALPQAQEPTIFRARMLSGLGRFLCTQGDYTRAQSLHEESLTIKQQLGDTGESGQTLQSLGVVACKRG
ncbi:MAG: hypothetical protein JWN14_2482, partial [Chthonomonadales bacterium]|nr:hypothetical protein [Chthonomonadales bacterium]